MDYFCLPTEEVQQTCSPVMMPPLTVALMIAVLTAKGSIRGSLKTTLHTEGIVTDTNSNFSLHFQLKHPHHITAYCNLTSHVGPQWDLSGEIKLDE